MIKIRITYHDKSEVNEAVKKLEQEFDVNSRIYIDLNLKK